MPDQQPSFPSSEAPRGDDERHLVLVNPRLSGIASVSSQLRSLLPVGYRIEFVEGTARMAQRARQAGAEGYERVVVVGGDGTVGIVLRGLLEEADRPPVGIIPLGTFNNFARSLDIPSDLEGSCRLLLDAVPHPIDLGRVTSRNPPATFVFKEMLGAGVDAAAFMTNKEMLGEDADVEDTAVSVKDLPGRAKIPVGLVATLRAIIAFRPHPVRFRCAGERRWGRSTQIIVANTSRYGAGFNVVPEARPDDGWLDVLARTWRGRLDLLRELPAILRGRHGDLEHKVYRRTKRVEIAGRGRVLLHADGEFFCRLPVEVEILEGALQVLVSPGFGKGTPSADSTTENTGGAGVPSS